MPGKTLYNSTWMIKDFDVSWPQRPKPGESSTLQRRRQISANLERDFNSWEVAKNAAVFFNASSSISNLVAYVGDSDNPGKTHPVTFTGVWQFEQIQTAIDGPNAHQRTTIWQYASAWEDVPTV